MMLIESYLWGRCDISTPGSRLESVESTDLIYDYIVVGAGTAGSIVAGRLSESGENNVLLLEAGGPEPLGARMPCFYRTFWGYEHVDWDYRVELDDYCLDQGEKGCSWPRGKCIGGSSVLNGMMFHKGHCADYDSWVEACNCTSWSWEALQRYFNMSEGNKEIGTLVSAEYHSETGKMPVQRFNYQPPEITTLLQIFKEAGLKVITDMNDPNTPEGFTVAQTFNHNGQRYTTARAYLSPDYSNLSVKMHAHVTKIIFNGTRAVGVEYLDSNGNTMVAHASKEVIISAGALNSPQILMLSGVGPKSILNEFEIPIVADLSVGQNLRNHIGATINFVIVNQNNTQVLDWNVFTEYMLTRGGPMSATGLTQLTGLLYSSLGNRSRNQPDTQVFVNGRYAECSRTGAINEPVTSCPNAQYNISFNVVCLLPRSVGYMTLRSTNPLDKPRFYANFLKHPHDMIVLKDGFDYIKAIHEHSLNSSMKLELDETYTLVCDEKNERWSDEWKECMIRTHTDPQNHEIGTTALGSVVDENLKIYGIENVRVCDAGSIPSHITGNPQGAIMALAEKCADLIKEEWQS